MNIALQQDIDFVTLRQWFNKFNVAGMKEVYLKPPPGVKNAKGSAFCLELFIHEDIVSFLSCIYLFRTFIFHSTLNEQGLMMKTRLMNCCRNARNGKGLEAARKIHKYPSELRVCHSQSDIRGI